MDFLAAFRYLRPVVSGDPLSGSPSVSLHIQTYNLTYASNVQRGVESLTEKEMIYHRDGCYFVYDVFLSRWLELMEV